MYYCGILRQWNLKRRIIFDLFTINLDSYITAGLNGIKKPYCCNLQQYGFGIFKTAITMMDTQKLYFLTKALRTRRNNSFNINMLTL